MLNPGSVNWVKIYTSLQTFEIKIKWYWWQGEQHLKNSILNSHNLGQTSLFSKSNK